MSPANMKLVAQQLSTSATTAAAEVPGPDTPARTVPSRQHHESYTFELDDDECSPKEHDHSTAQRARPAMKHANSLNTAALEVGMLRVLLFACLADMLV